MHANGRGHDAHDAVSVYLRCDWGYNVNNRKGPTMATQKEWTRERITRVLAGRETPPRVSEFRYATDTTPAYITIKREFGSWDAALKEAGWNSRYWGRGRRPKQALQRA